MWLFLRPVAKFNVSKLLLQWQIVGKYARFSRPFCTLDIHSLHKYIQSIAFANTPYAGPMWLFLNLLLQKEIRHLVP